MMTLLSTIVTVVAPNVKPFAGWSPCVAWCAKNCRGLWVYDGEGVFRFELDSEATAFALMWV
jgi:hypothetical protein